MVDQSKRRTMKLMSGMGAATIGGTVFSATSIAGINTGLNTNPTDSIGYKKANRLTIQIITGQSTPEDTVIFTNQSDRKIVVNEFLPRHVTFENQMLDLNSLCIENELCIHPNQPVASKLASWEVLALTPNSSYLWADHAFETFASNNAGVNHKSGVITIEAAVINGKALLTLVNDSTANTFS